MTGIDRELIADMGFKQSPSAAGEVWVMGDYDEWFWVYYVVGFVTDGCRINGFTTTRQEFFTLFLEAYCEELLHSQNRALDE